MSDPENSESLREIYAQTTAKLRLQEKMATLRVCDHGIGIDSEQQARIFDRFARAVSDREFGGLGLGLWIVRRIVEASGGSVTVQSAPGSGATFTVRLPITSVSSIRVTSDRKAAEAEPP